MEVKEVTTWVGLIGTICGAAVGYGTLTEKVSALESATDATYLESRLTKLETRIEDNDVRTIGKEIEQLRGANQRLSDKVSRIHVPSTGKIKSDIRVLQNEVEVVQKKIDEINEALKTLKNNPLG